MGIKARAHDNNVTIIKQALDSSRGSTQHKKLEALQTRAGCASTSHTGWVFFPTPSGMETRLVGAFGRGMDIDPVRWYTPPLELPETAPEIRGTC